jgi:hypothetical protein
MADELRNTRQYFPIRRLIAPTMGCAQEDQTDSRIADRLVPWLQPCLEQSLKETSAVELIQLGV